MNNHPKPPGAVSLAVPLPPLVLGSEWTGVSLLNWVLSQAVPEMRAALQAMYLEMGGDAFGKLWNDKAAEINQRSAGPRVVFCKTCKAVTDNLHGYCNAHKPVVVNPFDLEVN